MIYEGKELTLASVIDTKSDKVYIFTEKQNLQTLEWISSLGSNTIKDPNQLELCFTN